jgi:hypothetical protein
MASRISGQQQLVHSTVRASRADNNRCALNCRHFIDSLRRKPQAFKALAFRDALFPRDAYRQTLEKLEAQLTQRQACNAIFGLLELAGHHGVEALLAEQLDVLLAAGELPDLTQLRDEFSPRQALCPEVVIEMPPVAIYDPDHRNIKSRTNVMLGFERFRSAATTISGIELMLAFASSSSPPALSGSRTPQRPPFGMMSS